MTFKKFLWFTPAICVVIGIFLLSTVLSVPVKAGDITFSDKLAHGFAYFVLVFTFLFGFYKSKTLTKKITMIVVVLACIYGISLEFVQYSMFKNRYFEFYDMLANVAGSLTGLGLFKLIFRG